LTSYYKFIYSRLIKKHLGINIKIYVTYSFYKTICYWLMSYFFRFIININDCVTRRLP
jgi:hypothetical protein